MVTHDEEVLRGRRPGPRRDRVRRMQRLARQRFGSVGCSRSARAERGRIQRDGGMLSLSLHAGRHEAHSDVAGNVPHRGEHRLLSGLRLGQHTRARIHPRSRGNGSRRGSRHDLQRRQPVHRRLEQLCDKRSAVQEGFRSHSGSGSEEPDGPVQDHSSGERSTAARSRLQPTGHDAVGIIKRVAVTVTATLGSFLREPNMVK